MTSGSGNGWPDVIQVPAPKPDHDPLCPTMDDPIQTVGWNQRCECERLARARAAEQEIAENVLHHQIKHEREEIAKALIEEANKYRHGTETDYRHGIQYAASFIRRKR